MEILDLYDKHGNRTGETIERGRPMPDGRFFLIVDAWIINSKGEILISRRSAGTYPDPGKWQPTCGCAVAGEDSKTAAMREIMEELGIELDPESGKLIKRFTAWDKAIIDVWLFKKDVDLSDIIYQEAETDDAIWAEAECILQMAEDGRFLSSQRLPYIRELADKYIV